MIRVLCVEDNEHDRALIRDALENSEIEFVLIEAINRSDFEKKLEKGDFDIVLTDFNILGFEGLQVIHEVKKRYPNIPVIVVTGTGSEEIAVAALKQGADDYVIKTHKHIAQLPYTILHAIDAQKTRIKLHQEEENLRAILKNISDAILVVNKQGKILYVNPETSKLLGKSNDQLIGQLFGYPIIPNKSIEIDLPLKKGGPGIAEMRVTTIVWNNKESYAIVLHDITDRKKAEEEVQKLSKLFSHYLETSPTVTFALKNDNGKLIPIWISKNVIRLTGFTIDEVLQPDWWLKHVHPDEREQVNSKRKIILKKDFLDHEYHILCKNSKNYIWIREQLRVSSRNDEGQVLEVVGSWMDITELKEVQEAIRRSEKQYRDLVKLAGEAGEAIVVLRDQGEKKGMHVFFNEVWPIITGYSADELSNMSFFDLISEKERQKFFLQYCSKKKDKSISGLYELNIIKKNGSEVPIEIVCAWSTFDNKMSNIVYIRDISQRKKAEQEQAILQEQLRQAQKMESIGRLAGGVAHDFNNVLSVILGFAELIYNSLHPQDPLRDDIEQIINAGKQAAKLTRQLLAFSRKQTFKMEVLNLNMVINELSKMLKRLIGEDIELILVLEDNLQNIIGDPIQIEQVIMNLAVNARDAMPNGGKLIIETSNVELDENYTRKHVNVKPGNYVMLAVSDTGCGMDKETLSKIFEPFFTTKEKGQGTGLGLSTVYGIIKQTGGYIWAYSEPGKGTTFKIYLPQASGKLKVKKSISEEKSIAGKGEHILVVEDEESLRKLIEIYLLKLGYKITSAANGGEALLLVEEKGIKPDMIITDVIMPIMSGKELVERLQNFVPDLKVLYMSGYTDNAIVHHGILDQGIHFIQKPFDMSELAKMVRTVLEE